MTVSLTPQEILGLNINEPNQLTQPTNISQGSIANPTDPYSILGLSNPMDTTLNTQLTEKPGFGGAVLSTLSPVLDILSRPQYASAKFFDSLANDGQGIFEALGNSLYEFVVAKDKLSFSDVISKSAPEFARNNPISTKVLGFLGDIALDPTTYLGVGLASKGVKIGGQVLEKAGKEALELGLKTAGKEASKVEGGIDLLAALGEQLSKKKPNIAKISFLTNELETAGYFKQVGNKADEIKKFVSDLGLKTDSEVITDLAKNEVLNDLKGNITRKSNELVNSEVRERIEERIMRFATEDTDFASRIFKPKEGLRLTVGIPFSQLEKSIPYSEEAIRYLGLEPTKKLIESLKKVPYFGKALQFTGEKASEFGTQLKGLFVRPGTSETATLPFEKEYKNIVTSLENQLDYLPEQLGREVKSLIDLPEDRRILLNKTMSQIDDATRLFEKDNARLMTPKEANEIYTNILESSNLNNAERAIVANIQQQYKNAMELEIQAGLLKSGIENYNPRIYNILSDPQKMIAYRKNKLGLSTYLPSSYQREFTTLMEAEAKGFNPEMDAAKIFALRMLQSRRALAINDFKNSIKDIYSIPDNIAWGSKEMSKFIPGKILDDIKMLGESVYPSGMNESMRYFLQGYDRILGMFRKGATVAKPSFAPKQLFSNTFQALMQIGITALKAFDPRSFIDSALIISDVYRNKNAGSKLPDFLLNLFNKNGADSVLASRVALSRIAGEEKLLNYASDFNLTTALGEKISGIELVDELRVNGITKGFDATGERFTKSIEDALRYNPNSKADVTKELIKFWKFPSIAEDYGRASMYINARRMGYSPRQAANEVNKALFDYGRGLTSFEQNVARRLVPFYTYQRFAIPFVLQKTLERPGTVVSGQKFVNLLQKLIVDDTENLSPKEREIFGDSFLVEQPRLFTGFDNTGKAKFNVLNNLTPLDVLSLLVYDNKTGELDLQRTAEKSVLATITPFLKIPLEAAVNRQFFSGQTIDKAGKLGDLSSNSIGYVLPQVVKDAIGWEDRTNLTTGKTQTYINPYLAYTAFSAIPALKQFIATQDNSKSILDRTQSILFGIVPQSVDLKEQEIFQTLGEQSKVRELQSKIRLGQVRGSKNEYEKALEDYQSYIKLLTQKRSASGTVRGTGIQGTSDTTNNLSSNQAP